MAHSTGLPEQFSDLLRSATLPSLEGQGRGIRPGLEFGSVMPVAGWCLFTPKGVWTVIPPDNGVAGWRECQETRG